VDGYRDSAGSEHSTTLGDAFRAAQSAKESDRG
jgi:hypothetical protein